MQNQNWRVLNRAVAVAVVTLLVVSFTTLAVAQRIAGEERNAIFAAAPRVPTSVAGVTVLAAPPKGFNPLKATNRELLSYGLPQRPDKAANPQGYDAWERAMLSTKTRVTDVKATPYTSREIMGKTQTGGGDRPDGSGVTFYNSGNWSGIAQTNKLTRWSNTASFDEIVSIWNVPVANHPFGNIPCSEGPWFEVTWNGIDGFTNGDVVQGGSYDYWDDGGCGGPVLYYGWVEWYPSYSILVVYCNGNPCPVGPGDDFEVITYGARGTSEQFVFIEDVTQQWSGTIGLTYQSGPGLVGSSAEYIVERPCCNGSNLYPLGNYVWEFFNDSFAYNGAGTLFFPGNTGPATAIITMLADDGSTPISYDAGYGTAGTQGRYSIWIADENCAYSGGCTP